MREIHDAGKGWIWPKMFDCNPFKLPGYKSYEKVDCLNIRKIEKFLSNQEDPTNEGKNQQIQFLVLTGNQFDDFEIKHNKY